MSEHTPSLARALLVVAALALQSCQKVPATPTIMPTQSAVFTAVANKDIKLLKLAIENGGNVNELGIDGRTPLHNAILQDGGAEMVEVLVDAGADPGALAPQYMNCLHLAVMAGDVTIVRHLAKYNSLLDAKDYNGFSPLAYAVNGSRVDMVEVLLAAGASPCTKVARVIPLTKFATTVADNEVDQSGPAHRVLTLVSRAASERACPE